MTLDEQIEWWERQHCLAGSDCQLESEMPGFLVNVKRMQKALKTIAKFPFPEAEVKKTAEYGLRDNL